MDILKKITLLEKEAEAFGFAWPEVSLILQQIQDECLEIQEAIAAHESCERIQEEIGDLLHAALSLCIFMDFCPQETLEKTTEKFAQRFQRLKSIASQEGYANLKGESFEVLMRLWRQAKS